MSKKLFFIPGFPIDFGPFLVKLTMFRAFRKLGQPTLIRKFCTEAKEVKETIIVPKTCEYMFGQIGGMAMLSMAIWANIDSLREESRYSSPSGIRQLGQIMLIGPPLYFLGRGTGRMAGQHFILSKNIKTSFAIMALGSGLTAYYS